VLRPVMNGDVFVCFGSRTMKFFNLDDVLNKIYGGNFFLYLASKYGGLLLSIVGFLRQGQFLSDPLTQLRVFDYTFLDRLKLTRKNWGIIGEIIGKTTSSHNLILEVPVSATPRKASEGKKMNLRHGFEVLLSLWRRYSGAWR
jgi:hypothetical protein